MKTIKMIVCIMFLALSLSNLAQAEDKKESSTTSDEALVLRAGKKLVPGIHVYDANENYLGLLVTYGVVFPSPPRIAIYVLNIKAIVLFSLFTGEVYPVSLYYESNDCSGEPLLSPENMNAILYNKSSGKYYTGINSKLILRTIGSRLPYTGECHLESLPYPTGVAVEVPKQTLGFPIPVALPLQFKASIESLDK